jgi:hypothetical protein
MSLKKGEIGKADWTKKKRKKRKQAQAERENR